MKNSSLPDGYYWFTSERSSKPHIAERCKDHWYVTGESSRLTLEDLRMRGYRLERIVECPPQVLVNVGH